MAAKPKALVAKKGGQQIILVVPKDLKTSIGNSKNKIEAENSLQQGATNPFAEDHSPPSSPNHFHRWKSLLQLHWIWTAIAWSSHPQSFPVSLKLITDETLPVFLANIFANIFGGSSPMRPCQYCLQMSWPIFFWGSSPMRSSQYFPTDHKVGKSQLDQNPKHRLIQVSVQFLCE